jgi:DNA helicase-2/ATP-dependent DNA helicase PcrA
MRTDQEVEATGDRVTLSTLHASKGLEFPVVFLIGCIEGQLPHNRTTDPKITEAAPSDVEEERRLFYVGVTRAQDRLYLTRPRHAQLRGRVKPVTPSRFLDGLPEDQMTAYERDDRKPMAAEDAAEAAAAILAKLRG